jgi:hypothetical protein
MGGGSATPTTPVGYTGGSVMDYTAPEYSASMMQPPTAGFDWAALQKGINTGLQQYAAGASYKPQFSAPQNQAQQSIPGAPDLKSNVIPGQGMIGQSIPGSSAEGIDLMAVLQRILAGLK